MPRETAFNDTIAMDLEELTGWGRFLHIVDLGTRLPRCVVVTDKDATTIVCALLPHWICVFGAPRVVSSGPGRKFHNFLLLLLAERFNIRVDVRAAQSAWSDGIIERHNGVIKHMVATLATDYPSASLQELLDHACFAKNSLAEHGCASPLQLTTGSQPRLPSVLSDDMPAVQEGHLPTEADLTRTVAMLAASRAAFSSAEASQYVRRALNRRGPGESGRVYTPGDVVRSWEQSEPSSRRGMHGPAMVVSQAGWVVRLLHGGEVKTRIASDVELFTADVPSPSPVMSPGFVGAAHSALRHAAGPSESRTVIVPSAVGAHPAVPSARGELPRPPVVSRTAEPDESTAVAQVVDVTAVLRRGSSVPDNDQSAGLALAAATDDKELHGPRLAGGAAPTGTSAGTVSLNTPYC